MIRLLHSQIGLFFTLSAAFWGLLGSLLVLWGGFALLLTDSLRQAIPRLETFALLSANSLNGTAVFPDSSWAYAAAEHPCWSALILAFMHAFLAGGVSVIALQGYRGCDNSGPLRVMTFWGAILAVLSYGGSSSLVESGMWFLAALAPWPGFKLIESGRPTFLKNLSLGDFLGGAALLVLLAIIFYIGLLARLPYPQGEGQRFPTLTSTEAMLVVRDEVLPRLPGGETLSDGYYNNVVAANFFLRPPVSAHWIDVTAGLCGLDDSWQDSCEAQGISTALIKPDELLKVLQEGLRRPDGSPTGPGGLEIVLVESTVAADDFWQRVQEQAPAMLKRLVVIDGVDLVNPRLEQGFAHFDKSVGQHPADGWRVRDLLEKSLVAVQFVTDQSSFRDQANGWGLGLIKGIGLPMLLLWALTLVGVVVMGSIVGAGHVAGLPARILTGVLWLVVLVLGLTTMPPLSGWQQERAQATWLYEQLHDLSQREPGDKADVDLLVFARHYFESRWKNEWLTKFGGLDKLEAIPRSRAWAALSRLLEMAQLIVVEEKRQGGTPPPIAAPVLWTALSQGALLEAVSDPDPLVAYWALKVAAFVEPGETAFWSQVARRLKDANLNVRDRAVEALGVRGHPALLALLRDHYHHTPEPCAYVKLNAFKYLFEFRRR